MKNKVAILFGVLAALMIIILLGVFINNKSRMYSVTFDAGNGEEPQIVQLRKGSLLTRPDDPTRDGYTFVNWTVEGEVFDFNIPVTSNMILKAEWKTIDSSKKVYTIKFDVDGGTVISDQVVEEGSKVVKPSDPEKEGYTFAGWKLDGNEYDFESIVTQDLVLKATYDKKEDTKAETAVSNNNTSSNKKSSGSNNTSNSNTSSNNSNSGNSGTAPVVIQKYTVTFDSNGGSTIGSQTITGGSKVAQPSNPSREGYTFAGWKLNGSAYNFNTAVNSNITLVASWTQKTYVVKVSMIDNYSPDRVLTVYENGTKISVSAIKYTDGVTLCNGTNTTVNMFDIEGESSLIVVLAGGTQVTARVS